MTFFSKNKINSFLLSGQWKWVHSRVLKWSDIIRMRQWVLIRVIEWSDHCSSHQWPRHKSRDNITLISISKQSRDVWRVWWKLRSYSITSFKNAAKDSLPLPDKTNKFILFLEKILFINITTICLKTGFQKTHFPMPLKLETFLASIWLNAVQNFTKYNMVF